MALQLVFTSKLGEIGQKKWDFTSGMESAGIGFVPKQSKQDHPQG